MDYKIIKSKRKTIAIQIKNGEVIVRAPLRMPNSAIQKFVLEHQDWITTHVQKVNNNSTYSIDKLTEEEIDALRKRAKEWIPQRVKYYAPLVGVTYNQIAIRCQTTRWGSCSSKGNLNFNCLLMLMPLEVIDSVIVHELCHRKEMNHSKQFYAEVLRVYPEYRKWNRWLKDNGSAIMLKVK